MVSSKIIVATLSKIAATILNATTKHVWQSGFSTNACKTLLNRYREFCLTFSGTCSAEHASGELIHLSNESLLFHTFTYLLNSFTGKTMYLHHLLPSKFMVLFVIVAHSTGISLIAAWSLGKE